MSLMGWPVVIGLAFACPLLMPYFSEWSDPLPSMGSNHIPILLRFDAPFIQAPPPKQNWAMTNGTQTDNDVKLLKIPPPPSPPPTPWASSSTQSTTGSRLRWPCTPLSNASPTGQSRGGPQRSLPSGSFTILP